MKNSRQRFRSSALQTEACCVSTPPTRSSAGSTVKLMGIEVQVDDMYPLMKEQTLAFLIDTFQALDDDKQALHDQLAKKIKIHMDQRFKPSWKCVVGKGFSSAVNYINHHFLFVYIANKAIMIYK